MPVKCTKYRQCLTLEDDPLAQPEKRRGRVRERGREGEREG